MHEDKVILSRATYDDMMRDRQELDEKHDRLFEHFKLVSDGRKAYVFECTDYWGFFEGKLITKTLNLSYDEDSIVRALAEECEKLKEANRELRKEANRELRKEIDLRTYSAELKHTTWVDSRFLIPLATAFFSGLTISFVIAICTL